MTESVNYRVNSIPKLMGIIIIIVSGVVLIGEWIFDVSIFQIALPDLPKMVANTALAFMFSGISLMLLRSQSEDDRIGYIGQLGAIMTALIGVLTLSVYLVEWLLSSDKQMLLATYIPATIPNLSSPQTALNFILIGLSLVLLRIRNMRGYSIAQVLIILSGFIALLALLGYTYDVTSLYRSSADVGISVPTALLFILLCVGILFSRSDQGIVRIILSSRVDGDIVRRLLPAAFVIPFALGWIILDWMQGFQIELNIGLSTLVLLNIIAFAIMVWWTAIEIRGLDQKRQTAEIKLGESEKLLASILELAADPVITVNAQREIIQYNIAAQKVFGYTDAEILGLPFEKLLPTEFTQQHQQYIIDLASENEIDSRKEQQELRARRKNGDEFPIEISISKIDQNGETIYTSIVRDTTERVLAEKNLKALNQGLEQRTKELAQSNSDLQQFAYVASHDLQEPLRTITSFITLLADEYRGQLDEQADEYIAFTVDSAKRMRMLINDLLAYSRIDVDDKSLTAVNSDESLKTALSNLQLTIDETKAIITHDPLPTVLSDKAQATLLFQNLIGNAIKFSKENTTPEVHVSTTKRDGFWEFSISDNGIGMDSKYFDRIFVIFQRLHSKEQYQGTGIGMAICKRIVERGGGRIWLESELGVGTTFYFTLPMMQEQPA